MMADMDTLRLSEGAGASPQQPAWIHWRGRGYGLTVTPLVRPDRHLPGRGVGSRALEACDRGPWWASSLRHPDSFSNFR